MGIDIVLGVIDVGVVVDRCVSESEQKVDVVALNPVQTNFCTE